MGIPMGGMGGRPGKRYMSDIDMPGLYGGPMPMGGGMMQDMQMPMPMEMEMAGDETPVMHNPVMLGQAMGMPNFIPPMPMPGQPTQVMPQDMPPQMMEPQSVLAPDSPVQPAGGNLTPAQRIRRMLQDREGRVR